MDGRDERWLFLRPPAAPKVSLVCTRGLGVEGDEGGEEVGGRVSHESSEKRGCDDGDLGLGSDWSALVGMGSSNEESLCGGVSGMTTTSLHSPSSHFLPLTSLWSKWQVQA